MHAAERWRSWQRHRRRHSRMCPVPHTCAPSWPQPFSSASLPLLLRLPSPLTLPAACPPTAGCRKVDAEALQAIKSQRAKARAEGMAPGVAAVGGTGRVTPPPGTVAASAAGAGVQDGPGISPFASATSQGLARSPSSNNIGSLGSGLGHATSLPISMHSAQRTRRSPAGTPPASSAGAAVGVAVWCGCRVACAWCEGHLRRHAAGAARNTTSGWVADYSVACLPCMSPCLPGAADYDAMVSKMTITELVALKQARSAQPSFAAHKSALRRGPAACPAAASAAAAVRASGCRLRLTACSVQRRCQEGGPSCLPPVDCRPLLLCPHAGG